MPVQFLTAEQRDPITDQLTVANCGPYPTPAMQSLNPVLRSIAT